MISPTSKPILWSDSYELRGIRHDPYEIRNGYGTLLTVDNSSTWHITCKLCTGEKVAESYENSKQLAINLHFQHCSKVHSYIYPENTDIIFKVEDSALQSTIMLAMEHDLPLPGYENHDKCIKKYLNNKVICVIHQGNEHITRHYLGVY